MVMMIVVTGVMLLQEIRHANVPRDTVLLVAAARALEKSCQATHGWQILVLTLLIDNYYTTADTPSSS
eukprot:2776243-Karenia_brevis.AAC.1